MGHCEVLMRHAARTPPPSDFIVCGLLRLMLFRKIAKCRTKFLGERSLLQVLRSSLPVLCGYLALILVVDGLAEFVPTAMKAEGKRVPKSIKVIQNKTLAGALWRLLGR